MHKGLRKSQVFMNNWLDYVKWLELELAGIILCIYQWETNLQCNAVSHWMGTQPKMIPERNFILGRTV